MSEDRNAVTDETTEPRPTADDVFAATVPAPATLPASAGEPEKPGRGRELLAVVLPAVLVLGLIGAGVTYTGVTVSAADRTAPTVVWEEPDPAGAAAEDPALGAARGNASTPLSKLLLPVPSGYELGPDIETYGNDGELGEKEAVALMKREGEGLSGKKRRDYEKRVDRLGIQGIAVRSFASAERDIVVYVHIMRMKDKGRVKDMFELRKELSKLLKFPKGPKIGGYANSACSLMPTIKGLDKEEQAAQLDGMLCAAYDSEVFVSVFAAGSRPFDKSAVAALVEKQLDHIKSPGEYI